MKKIWLFATAAGLGFCASAQTQLSLADHMRLADMQAQGAKALSATGVPAKASVSVFYRVDGDQTVDALRAAGVNVLQQEGNIVICDVPVDAVSATLSVDGVRNAELGKKRRLLNNIAREVTGVDKIRSGEGLSQPYDGTGVIAGIFDSGVDPNHIAFKDAEGNLRVSRFFNFTGTDTSHDTYIGDDVAKYGGDYSETHGCHTLGTLASSYVPLKSGNDFSGIATGADIAAAQGMGYDPNFTGALRCIADYAHDQGKPCVINLSWGANDDGPHDGTDSFTQALNRIAGEEGVHLFMSSGNEGDNGIGVYKELTEADNTLKTFIQPTDYNAAYGGPGSLSQGLGVVSVWADTSDPVDAFIEIYDLESPETPIYSLNLVEGKKKFLASGWKTPSGVSSSEIDRSVSEFTSVYSQSYMGGTCGVSPVNGCYRVEMAFDLTSSTRANNRRYVVAIRMVGVPGQKLHAYAADLNADPRNPFYLAFGSKGIDGFEESIGDGTLNSMSCGSNFIVVGAYSSRQGGEDTNSYGAIYPAELEIHCPVSFSSWGHMLDGTLKPDVLAPGYVIISTMNTVYARSHFNSLSENFTPVKDVYEDENGKPYYWTIMAGTSMASPHMAGVAALWLQADPDLTTEDIRDVIKATSYKPEGASDKWGPNGLVNAYEGLKYILGESAIKDVASEESAIMINPEGEGLYEVSSPAESGINVVLYNMQGAQAAAFATDGTELQVSTAALPAGVYVLRASTATSSLSHKIVVK